MKRIATVLAVCCMLFGCKSDSGNMDQALSMRQKLISASSCSFDAKVTAEYSDKAFTFLLQCSSDKNGNVSFTVTEPDSISNISGYISELGGNFTFDDTVLAFDTLANGSVSPVIAPWLMIRSLRSGYISHCARTEQGICVDIDDTYKETNLRMEIYLSEQSIPINAEMYYEGRRILSVAVSNFEML